MRMLSLLSLLLATAPVAVQAGTVAFSGTRENVNPLSPPGSGRCAPTYFNTVTITPGNLSSTGTSNLGAFTSTQSHCLVTAPPTQLVDGLFSYDFGGGEFLTGTYTGETRLSGQPGILEAIENLVVTGGTGRFAGATGTISSIGRLRFGQVDGRQVAIVNAQLAGTLSAPGIPEPASWALMIVGFAGVGFARRRRTTLAYA